MTIRSSALLCLALFCSVGVRANIILPSLISDHMVLEKTAKVPIWGNSDPGEKVSITLDGQTVSTTADAQGTWIGHLDLSHSPPGPFTMKIEGKDQHFIKDVVVGEVWVAGGQSNMEFILDRSADATAEIAQSANPMLRQFKVSTAHPLEPMKDCTGAWTVAGPETAGDSLRWDIISEKSCKIN